MVSGLAVRRSPCLPWMFFLRMKEKGVPMVAAIHGPALGGGLEWGELCLFLCDAFV